jgi:hypothetical protein
VRVLMRMLGTGTGMWVGARVCLRMVLRVWVVVNRVSHAARAPGSAATTTAHYLHTTAPQRKYCRHPKSNNIFSEVT